MHLGNESQSHIIMLSYDFISQYNFDCAWYLEIFISIPQRHVIINMYNNTMERQNVMQYSNNGKTKNAPQLKTYVYCLQSHCLQFVPSTNDVVIIMCSVFGRDRKKRWLTIKFFPRGHLNIVRALY